MKLRWVTVQGAKLCGTKFIDAGLEGLEFKCYFGVEFSGELSPNNLRCKDLNELNLKDRKLKGVKIRGAIMKVQICKKLISPKLRSSLK